MTVRISDNNQCPVCGSTPMGEGCYHICPNSVHFYSPEQEREDDRWSAVNRDYITEAYAATAEPSQYDDLPHTDEPEPERDAMGFTLAKDYQPVNDDDIPF